MVTTWQQTAMAAKIASQQEAVLGKQQVVVLQDGVPFIVRWQTSAMPETVEELTQVGALGDYHQVAVHGAPVCDSHVVVSDGKGDNASLEYHDFLAIARLLREKNGLVLYDEGHAAGGLLGAKHWHWVCSQPDSTPSLGAVVRQLDHTTEVNSHQCSPMLSMPHTVVKTHSCDDVDEYARGLFLAYQLAAEHLQTQSQCDLSAFSLLLDTQWMLVVPRRRRAYESITVNAFAFAGLFMVASQGEQALIEGAGPLNILVAVCY